MSFPFEDEDSTLAQFDVTGGHDIDDDLDDDDLDIWYDFDDDIWYDDWFGFNDDYDDDEDGVDDVE